MKNVKWEKLFICETNKASRGGGWKSPKEPAHISACSGSVGGPGRNEHGALGNIKKDRC